MIVTLDMFSFRNEYGASFDELNEEGYMTHTVHMALQNDTGVWERNYIMMSWHPPGTELFGKDDPLRAIFPNYNQDPDDLVLDGEDLIPANWEIAL